METVPSWITSAYRAYVRGPEHPSKLRIVRWIERCFGASLVMPVEDGFRLRLYQTDIGDLALMRGERYEVLTLTFLRRNVRRDDVVLIAGVTNGLDVLVASQAAGTAGRVIAVEPQPRSVCIARENFLLNNSFSNIMLVCAALGSEQGVASISPAPEANSGWSSIVLRDPGELPFRVRTVSVPALLHDLELARLDFMLLDVEGFELHVLQGMASGPLPSILILEAHPIVLSHIGKTTKDYTAAVAALGYDAFDLLGAPVGDRDRFPENNLVCLRGVDPSSVRWSS